MQYTFKNVKKLYLQGYSTQEIADYFLVARQTISNNLMKMGIQIRKSPLKLECECCGQYYHPKLEKLVVDLKN